MRNRPFIIIYSIYDDEGSVFHHLLRTVYYTLEWMRISTFTILFMTQNKTIGIREIEKKGYHDESNVSTLQYSLPTIVQQLTMK